MKQILGLALAAAAILSPVASGAQPGGAGTANSSSKPMVIAVLGDTPYGPAQFDRFGSLVDAVNADPKVRTVVHVGDIKNGGTRCDTSYFEGIADHFASFADPVVYTPGDNEWTDCHRTTNGAYQPLERLATVRSTFFPAPGRTLGRRDRAVVTQGGTFVENVRWVESQVAFATVHVVGSDNGRLPWTPDDPTARLAEVAARTKAAVEWIDAAFDDAEARGLRGVVLAMQADTWNAAGATRSAGFTEVNERMSTRAANFDGEVLVLQGDTHRFVDDRPIANVRRVVVEGETIGEYLRLLIRPKDDVLFAVERVAVAP